MVGQVMKGSQQHLVKSLVKRQLPAIEGTYLDV